MAEALIILLAVASVVGVFFLVLFSLLARREHRWKTTTRHAQPKREGPFHISWRAAAVVLVLAILLAGISFLPWRSRR